MPAHSKLPRQLPRDLQEAMLKREKPGPTIRRRSRKTISIPPWCPLTHHILEGGIWTADYQNALDDYCIQRLDVADPQRRIMVFFDAYACTTCQTLPNYGGYSVCRHIGRVVDFDLANEDGFMVSASLPVCVPVRLPAYVSGC